MKVRLTIAPGDSFDFTVKPFDTLTCAEHIRIFETRPADEYLDLWPDVSKAKGIIKRYSGAPDRFIRHLSSAEVKAVMERINDATKENDRLSNVMRKVQDTLDGWAKEHDGKDWTLDDVIGVLNGHGIYRSRIKVNGRIYTAPVIEESATFGQWIDLQEAMDVDNEVEGKAETMSYVRALSVLMEGADGPYPVQGASETDAAYEQRTMAYTQQRREDFLAAPFVDVLGVAAFFFSNSGHFAAICAHNMSSLTALLPRSVEPVRRIIPRGGGLMPS